jgi:DNA invertase Pin-like site-specific DNA recombinase
MELTMRAVIYARYSSDNQREASIEDQVRTCRAFIEDKGWTLASVYTDAAISGATVLRPGYQKLLEDARKGGFEVVVAEALDRLSRDQEDVAGLYKQLSFAGVKLVTVTEGEINELHVGLKGTMNALYLRDLAHKTRRGLEGRVRQGRSGGGLSYGYGVVQEYGPNGLPVFGARRIVDDEASIIRRMFEEFASGRSPRAIAHALNREGVKGPRGRPWGPSTIYGNWRRGTGVLNNELYVGRLVWNRQRFVKDPRTGRRVAKPNPQREWVLQDVPDLRIVSDELWARVKERQSVTRSILVQDNNGVRAERARRPRYLFSHLLKCGVCGGGCSMVNATDYACTNARNRGICDNRLAIRRDVLEESVLAGLKSRLMQPDLVKEFVAEYHRELNRLAAGRDDERKRFAHDLAKAEREIKEIIEAIKAGIRTASMAAELEALEARKIELQQKLTGDPPPVRLHPNLAEIYRQKVGDLRAVLDQDAARDEAHEILRGLIDEIRLTPVDGAIGIYLVGNLAAILNLCSSKRPGAMTAGAQVTLVAGARTHLYRTVLTWFGRQRFG